MPIKQLYLHRGCYVQPRELNCMVSFCSRTKITQRLCDMKFCYTSRLNKDGCGYGGGGTDYEIVTPENR